MFGTLISGVGLLDTSIDNPNQTMMHHGNATKDNVEKDSMGMMQH